MWKKLVLALVGLWVLLALASCSLFLTPTPTPGPELVVYARRGSPCVRAEVRHISGEKYEFDFGDGTEPVVTEVPEASHCYAELGVYTLTVRAHQAAPVHGGPPWLSETTAQVLRREIDLRPKVGVRRIKAQIVGPPPNWYSPDWPEYYLPAACPIEVSAELQILEPTEFSLTFTLFSPSGKFLLQEKERLLIPPELFVASGCPAVITPYRVHVVLEADGALQAETITLYAVPPGRRP